jgi:hypothetical protein
VEPLLCGALAGCLFCTQWKDTIATFQIDSLFLSSQVMESNKKMDVITILEFFAACLATGGAVWSFLLVIWKRKAQIEFRKKLQREEFLNKAEQLKSLMEHLSTDSSDLVKIHEAQLLLEEQLISLKESYRKQILEGLHQPSITGRARYIVKLLTEALDSNAAPQTVPSN